MKELFIIISSKYRRLVPSKFEEKLMGHFRGRKITPNYLARKIVSMKTLYQEHSRKIILIVLAFNVTFIKKPYGDTKRKCII